MLFSKTLGADQRSLEEVNESIDTTVPQYGWRRIINFLGPAYLISVGYMDPGNWATDIGGGSRYGYALIWVLLLSNLMAVLLQYLSAKLGIVRRLDLAQASREKYPKLVNYTLYGLAEIAIAATDLAEVLGMAIGLNLLFGLPLLIGVSITILDTFLILFFQKLGMRKIEVFIITLISIIGISFLINLILAKPDFGEVVTGFIPSIPDSYALFIAIGIIGATVMPHNLYLHSALVQTRKIERTTKGIHNALKYNLIDSTIAMNVAFLVNSAILILAASTFFKGGFHNIAGIEDAYQMLTPLLGSKLAPTLFAIALIAAGQSSTITGTLAGQVVMEGYLYIRIQPWMRRIITRLLAIIPALITIIIFGNSSTVTLLILSQVILSMQLGFAVIPLIHFVSDKNKMGEFAIKPLIKILSWVTAILIVSLNVKLIYDTFIEWFSASNQPILQYIAILLAGGLFFLILYITFGPLFIKRVSKVKATAPHTYSIHLSSLIEPKPIKKIAVPIDFSPSDLKAISTAASQLKNQGEVVLIHIVESAGAMIMKADIRDLESIEDRDKLEEYVHSLESIGINATYELGFGTPRKEIPKIIEKIEADMIVMGSHGHRGIKDLIFGETVDYVRHHISIPLLVV
ncbi:MAG: Nramp family divalent metal transporter [Chloroherpetonaceae bacterium]